MMWLDGQRLVRAALVGVAMLLVTGALMGLASAGADDAAGEVVPARRPGDRATYSVTQVILDRAVARGEVTAFEKITVEWLPALQVVDAQFGVRWAHPLRSTSYFAMGTPYESVMTHESLFDAATGAKLFQLQNLTVPLGSNDGLHYGIILDEQLQSQQTVHMRAQWYDGQVGPCGIRTSVQGATHWPAAIDASGCSWPGGPASLRYERRGWHEEDDGGRSRVYRSEDGALRLWFDGASSFPRRAETALAERLPPEYTRGRMFTLERIAFEQGAQPYAAAEQGVVEPGPGAAPTVPLTPWMLDDSGVDHPLPLARAYAALLAETQQSDGDPAFPEWLAAHPGAYVGWASYADLTDRQGYSHPHWFLIVTDGAAWTARVVELVPANVAYAVFLPPEAGHSIQLGHWTPNRTWLDPFDPHPFAWPHDLPQRLPAVAGLMARYDALAAADGRPRSNAYGLSTKCWTTCDALLVSAAYSVGDHQGGLQIVGDAVMDGAGLTESLWADTQGNLARRYHVVTRDEASFPVVPAATQTDAHETPRERQAAGFQLPATPEAAAGVGLAALVAAALYHFWPAVKGLPLLAGFSRIEDDKVMEHPRRAQIVQLVQAQPGIHFQDMCRRLGLGRGNLEHHLRKLLAAGQLTKVQTTAYACYFPKGAVDRRVMQAAPVLRSAGGRAVFDAVRASPGLSSRDLAGRIGVAPSTVSYHLKKLEEAGLVVAGGMGTVGVRLSPLGEQAAA